MSDYKSKVSMITCVSRKDLKDSDIPHIDTLRVRILQSLDQYLIDLAVEMQVSAQWLLLACY